MGAQGMLNSLQGLKAFALLSSQILGDHAKFSGPNTTPGDFKQLKVSSPWVFCAGDRSSEPSSEDFCTRLVKTIWVPVT